MSEAPNDLQQLRTLIGEMVLKGDQQLPPEPKLAAMLEVTRGRLRTLLKRVEDEGLIWRHVGKGTFIGSRDLDPKSPQWFDGISLGDIMEARRLLEPMLASQAAIAARPSDIAALESCLAEMLQTSSFLHWKQLDERLHRLIAEATHNSLLLLLYETLRAKGRTGLDTRINAVFGHEAAPVETNEQHAAIVMAIKNGDPIKAGEDMRLHLTHIREKLFGLQ